MARKSLIITIVAHVPYIKSEQLKMETCADDWYNLCAPRIEENAPFPIRAEQELLFSAISETYLPLLKMFRRLKRDGVPFKIVMVFSPTLCSLLTDSSVQAQYALWLERLIQFGEKELERSAREEKEFILIERYLQCARENKTLFVDELKGDILSEFKRFVSLGHIEPMATCATNAFLPHFASLQEVVNAQIEVGLMEHKDVFAVAPDGFWLPRMGYTPGIEKTLRAYGLNYTILETHGVLFARPIPHNGIFSPVRCGDSLVVFARDQYAFLQVAGKEGFFTNPTYRNQNRDAAFEQTTEELSSLFCKGDERISSGYKYYAKRESQIYDSEAALLQAKNDAREFLKEKQTRLEKAAECNQNQDALLMCAYNADVFGGIWYEGVVWLEEIFRAAFEQDSIKIDACLERLDNQAELQKVEPYPSAGSGAGYGEDLLDNSNAYLFRYVKKACDRMLDLAERFSNDRGLKVRTLNLAAKEALLAQSSDWAYMLNRRLFAEYADARFKEFILAFSTVFDSLGSNSISTEWLTTYEKKHSIFQSLNYRVFSRKKS
jgi:1,4-alpha-glucan branching enzyme